MVNSNASYERNFSEWLAKQVSPAQLSAIYLAFTEINKFCLSRKILKKPLFETDNLAILLNVRETVEHSKIFAFTYKKQKSTMIMAIQYYYRFIKETQKADSSAEPQHVSNIELKGQEQKAPLNAAITTQKMPLTTSSKKNNRLNFIEWLNKRDVPTGNIFVILSSLKHCSERMKAEKLIDDDIYHIMSTETMKAAHSFLLADTSFINADLRKRKQLSNALNVYLEFFNEQLTQSTSHIINDTRSETSSSAISTISEIDRLLCDDVFLPLRLALKNANISTIEELKALKLWVFMNQNNLYSISTRQAILTKVQHLLDPEVTENSALLFELHCGMSVYYGSTPAKAFLHFCEDTAKKYPLIFRSLLDKPIDSAFDVKISHSPESDSFIRMENPTCYIKADLADDSIISAVEGIMKRCEGISPSVSIKDPDVLLAESSLSKVSSEKNSAIPICSVHTHSEQKSESTNLEQIEEIEKIVLNADMSGTTYDCLSQTLNLTMVATKTLVQQCKHIVEIKGRLYHEKAFVDWDDGANQMCLIIEKLMQKNNGYVSAVQLYDYARAEMNMFLNDNDVNDERSVYEIAQHLFEKNSFGNNHYSFTGKAHISEPEKAISSNFDIICKFSEDQGGIFREEDLSEYLVTIGIKAGNLRTQMHLNKEPEFFFYEPGTIISAKSMGIDNSWKESVGLALRNLLNDADDHIILREIQPVWFESLPSLPEHRHWTPLLLQYILRFYGEELGAKTITAMKSQSMDTLHAMLVKYDGPIQNFGDAVISYLIENEIGQRSFESEELRQLLVKSGMIQGNELIGNIPKALAKDERFAWDAKGENVTIRV